MQTVYAVVDNIQQFTEGGFGGSKMVLPDELREEMVKFDQDAQREVFAKVGPDSVSGIQATPGFQGSYDSLWLVVLIL